jgi:NADPH:quinone reductase-like Zn-dependent oxidoreductase
VARGEAVNEATDGQGVDVVFDGVGGDTFPTSIR